MPLNFAVAPATSGQVETAAKRNYTELYVKTYLYIAYRILMGLNVLIEQTKPARGSRVVIRGVVPTIHLIDRLTIYYQWALDNADDPGKVQFIDFIENMYMNVVNNPFGYWDMKAWADAQETTGLYYWNRTTDFLLHYASNDQIVEFWNWEGIILQNGVMYEGTGTTIINDPIDGESSEDFPLIDGSIHYPAPVIVPGNETESLMITNGFLVTDFFSDFVRFIKNLITFLTKEK